MAKGRDDIRICIPRAGPDEVRHPEAGSGRREKRLRAGGPIMQHVRRRETLIDMHITVEHMWRHVEDRYAGRGLHRIWWLRSLRQERVTENAEAHTGREHPSEPRPSRGAQVRPVDRAEAFSAACALQLVAARLGRSSGSTDPGRTVDAADMGTRMRGDLLTNA